MATPSDSEILRVAGDDERFERLSQSDRIRECFKFNDAMIAFQAKLPGGAPGLKKGVYRFATEEEYDRQWSEAEMRIVKLRSRQTKKQ